MKPLCGIMTSVLNHMLLGQKLILPVTSNMQNQNCYKNLDSTALVQ